MLFQYFASTRFIKDKISGNTRNSGELPAAKPELFRLYENAVFRYRLLSTYVSVARHTHIHNMDAKSWSQYQLWRR
jgi:hypothetical protein